MSLDASSPNSVANVLPEVSTGDARRTAAVFQAGARIGRYVVEEQLEDDGVGALYAAHDRELDRTVALRLIPARDGDDSPYSRRRLLRETRSMARLSHPNVIQILDVGATRQELFIAMERLEGETAARWIDRTGPGWAEVLAVFVEAGQGLAAAHEAGFVHGDFEARSILRTESGRVVVTDFGLTRARTLDDGGTNAGTDTRLVRDDQHAFCSALYVALFHEAPPVIPVDLGQRPAVRDAGVPTHVVTALARGLGREDRFASMRALLGALRPEGRRLPWALLAGGMAFVGGAGLAYVLATDDRRCDPEGLPEGIDTPSRARALEAIRSSEQPHAEDSARFVQAHLDAWTGDWSDAWAQACRDGASEPTPCLRHSAAQAGALLSRISADTAAQAAPAVLQLPDACPDPPVPDATWNDAWAQFALDDFDGAIGTLQAAGTTHDPLALALLARAQAKAGASQAAARTLRSLPKRDAALRLTLAAVLLDDLQRPEQAGPLLVALHDEDLPPALEAERLRLDATLAQSEGDTDRARKLLAQAEASLDGAGDAAILLAADVALRRGAFEVSAGAYEAAMEHFRRAQNSRSALLGLSHPLVADAMAEVAGGWIGLGDLVAARNTLQSAVSIFEATHPPDHPTMLQSKARLALLLGLTGRTEDSFAMFDEVIAAEAARAGENSEGVAKGLVNRGILRIEAGQLREAKADLDRALSIRRAVGDVEGQATVLSELANIALEREDPLTAERLARESLALHIETRGEGHPLLSPSLFTLGKALLAQPARDDDAREVFDRALTLVETTQGEDHLNIAYAMAGLGRLDARAGRFDDARPRLERAIALLQQADFDVELQLECRLALADVEWGDGHKDTARNAATSALASAREHHPLSAPEIEAWLRDHGGLSDRAAEGLP